MKTSQSIAEITKALVLFDQENPVIKKNKEAKLGTFTIEYADLESTIAEVRPLLSKHGLRVTHTFDGMTSEAMVSHTSGEFITSSLAMPQASSDPKATGALISYYRRYQLNAILGLAADDADTDLTDTPKAQPTQHAVPKPTHGERQYTCPACHNVATIMSGVSKKNNKPYSGLRCSDNKAHMYWDSSEEYKRIVGGETADGLPTIKHDQYAATKNLAEASGVEDDGIDQMSQIPF